MFNRVLARIFLKRRHRVLQRNQGGGMTFQTKYFWIDTAGRRMPLPWLAP